MARKTITKKKLDEKQFAKDLAVIKEVLGGWGVELGDILRYRKIGTTNRWSEVSVVGVNKDMSIQCAEPRKGRVRSFLPGYAVDLELKTTGPKGGENWEPLA